MTPAAEEPASRTDQLQRALRRMPLVRQVIPQEAGIGWPLPQRKASRLLVVWPFYGMTRPAAGQKTDVFPIFATVTVAWATKIVVEYVDLQYSGACPRLDPPVPVGQFPHPALSGLSVGEYRQGRARLLALYDQLFDVLEAGGEFDPRFLAEFGGLLTRYLEPGLEPQYRALAGPFVARFLDRK
jgi:hypothetical protein